MCLTQYSLRWNCSLFEISIAFLLFKYGKSLNDTQIEKKNNLISLLVKLLEIKCQFKKHEIAEINNTTIY